MGLLSKLLNGLFSPNTDYTVKSCYSSRCAASPKALNLARCKREEKNSLHTLNRKIRDKQERLSLNNEKKEEGQGEVKRIKGMYCPSCKKLVTVKEVKSRLFGKREVFKCVCTSCGRILRYSLTPTSQHEIRATQVRAQYAKVSLLERRKNNV